MYFESGGTSSVAGSSVSGNGANGQVTLWNGPSSITGDAGLTWSGTGATFDLTVGRNLTITGLTASRVTLTGTAGLQKTDAGLVYSGTGATFDLTVGRNLTVTGLTAARPTLTTTAGLQTTDSGFTWSGTGATFDLTVGRTMTAGAFVTASLQGSFVASPYGVAAGQTGESRWLELAANGTKYVGFKAPDAVTAASKIYVLPAAVGTDGQVLTLSTAATGTLSWTTASGANPAGSGSEIQYRSNATTFGAVPGSNTRAAGIGLGTPTTADPLADNLIATSATTQKGLVIQMKASPTADAFDIQASTGDHAVAMGINGQVDVALADGQIALGSGSTTSPAIAFDGSGAASNTWGIWKSNTAGIGITIAGNTGVMVSSAGALVPIAGTYSWTNGLASSGTATTALSQIAPGVVGVGNGTAGDTSGTAKMAHANISSLAAFANNAAAAGGGLSAGDLYVVTGSDPRQVAVVF